MDAKEYLKQAKYLDLQIHSKLRQLESLKELLLIAGETDGTVTKIAALQEEINREIDGLADRKQEMLHLIGRLSKTEYRILMELRYLRRWPWEKIEENMHFSRGHLYRVHRCALEEFDRLLKGGNQTDTEAAMA
jgi:DNA-directed RNA polymerase specialized sigma subunit